ncbi:YqhG family protein [Paenibacillus eucommiae]|uniref:Uncharacterized protein n=1 Tax=Paenibacillus eucommiae TaxID=1355755 RepID=A0ABS4IRD2_9BACL|nr:YqhG family protein [Paenibacillus eucommiae]MBP1989159.1 hypothetical protein [Paenibacillus eucommiae]
MNKRHIQAFVMRFLEVFGCSIIEKTPEYVTVKLSPDADKELTGRSYYWSFVERTGAPAETMTYTFVFDPERIKAELKQGQQTIARSNPGAQQALSPPAQSQQRSNAHAPNATHATHGPQTGQTTPAGRGPAPAVNNQASDVPQDNSILGRYFGFVPTTVVSRIPRDEINYGSRRLEQLFDIVQNKGRFVYLFEEPFSIQPVQQAQRIYDTWFTINYKVELVCDMKRSEIHSLAIKLNSGEIRDQFHKKLLTKNLSPRLPANLHILPATIPLPKAMNALELALEHTVSRYDHRWADEANERHHDEAHRIDDYYLGLIGSAEAEQKADVEAQYVNRRAEIDWQYKPRILVSVINCGIFHLSAE